MNLKALREEMDDRINRATLPPVFLGSPPPCPHRWVTEVKNVGIRNNWIIAEDYGSADESFTNSRHVFCARCGVKADVQ